MDDLVRGLADQRGDLFDKIFPEDVTNHLFESKSGKGGLDLVSLNIQRGRDHGLPGYNAYREICQIGKARDFDDLTDYMNQGITVFILLLHFQNYSDANCFFLVLNMLCFYGKYVAFLKIG